MPLTNLKRAEIEQSGGTLLGEPVDAAREDYFYGLTITLEEPELQKLGFDKPEVGTKIQLMAVAKIESYSESDTGRSLTLKITDLGMPDTEEQDRTNIMYPGEG